jgi:hypothetical protein
MEVVHMRQLFLAVLFAPLLLVAACGDDDERKTVIVNPPPGGTVVVPPSGQTHVCPDGATAC